MKKNLLNHAVAWIWVANITVCLAVIAIFGWFRKPTRVEAIAPIPNQTRAPNPAGTLANPTITPIPPPTRRATITPWPTTQPGPSVTPMVLPAGSRIIIGYSIENRPQEVYRFGNGPINKLIIAGIHGGSEWNTIQLADELIAYLAEHSALVPSNTTLFILRDLNPDGTARGKGLDGRANANGVDLNHNWPYNWQADWDRNGCWNLRKITGGTSAGSEPEVKNTIDFIDKIKPVAIISYHSAALGIFPGGKPDFPPSISLADAVAEASDYPYPPIKTGCEYTGNLTDWSANTRKIASIDIELSNHRYTDFEQNLRILQIFLTWEP